MPSRTFAHSLNTSTFRGSLSLNTGLFIDGRFVDPIHGGSIETINPATGEVITSVSIGTKEDVDVAVKAAQTAYKNVWGLKTPGSERGRLLSKLADLLEAHGDELSALETLDVGLPFSLVKGHFITTAAATLRYFGGWASKVQGRTIETSETKFCYTRREPFGVVGQIIPWNVPLICLVCKIAPALAAGNTIVLKPSEITPLTAQKMAELIIKAGFPSGVVNFVNGYGNTVGQAISEHPQIRKISFTGSTATGRRIQEASSRTNLKPVSLELGGKSPNIIFEDADLDQAVKWAANGVFRSAGQMCTADSRILVQESIYDKFLEAFVAMAKVFSVKDDPFEASTLHSPQISQTQLERVESYIGIANHEGARIVVGGKRMGGKGFYFEPTVIEASNDMRIAREEIFGPVACLIKFKTEEEAIEIANDTEYGLACAVFTENSTRAIRVIHALEAGNAFVNAYNTISESVPFGGYKQSGVGRENGEEALEMYTQVKAVHMNLGLRL